ncbi:dihydrodipicolinate synthase family protein [Novosphingobium sp. fls2-241-R2A-195]|uniref:dihydrodipicolinate synthase family protein n=1 Tax=Novosphingobium sp. fls2-241-R2A-195 TaxID=3040296 RepID=UPI00254D1D2C|nr:dihydrodipicolinate synthase family protein [Novosphingobium sp. fls2-241-R2A-195]
MACKRDRVGWKGYLPAITTPFDDQRNLDFDALGTLLEWLHGEGMHGLVVAGTTGEWFSLDAGERHALFAAAGAQMGKRLPLIAGCSAYTPAEVLAHIEQAHAAGFSGALVTPPPYARPGDEDILAFYTTIARHSRLPICVYNWPPGTEIDLSLPLLERIAALDAVVAIKHSTGDMAHFMATFFALHAEVRVFGLPLDEVGLTMVRLHDADGTMGAGGVLGHNQPDFYNLAWQGDFDRALACGAKDRVIMREWFTPSLVGRFGSAAAILKAALNARGVPGGRVRSPFQDVSAADAGRIAATLAGLGCLGDTPGVQRAMEGVG